MGMATLERRVQVLFDPAMYAALEAEALSQRQSVAAVIREAVNDRLDRRRVPRREALERLLASADNEGSPIEWDIEKETFERAYLGELP